MIRVCLLWLCLTKNIITPGSDPRVIISNIRSCVNIIIYPFSTNSQPRTPLEVSNAYFLEHSSQLIQTS